MIATNIEQSKKLLELGLSPDTADMFWEVDENCISVMAYNLNPGVRYTKQELITLFQKRKDVIPSWSIAAFLKLMPNVIYGPEPKDHPTEFMLSKVCIGYFDWTGMQHGPSFETEDDPINGFYKLMVWLLENNYINTEKK